jgi:hypothetical protein
VRRLYRKQRVFLCHELIGADKLGVAWNDPSAIADRPTFDPLSAGGMLLGVLVACVAIGALVGWAAGSVGIGVLIGSLIGIPAAIAAVYRTYRGVL